MTRMEMFRQFFPENDPLYGKEQIDTPEVIDGEYLSGAFDGFLEETGLSPEEIGVSPGAVEYRKQENEYMENHPDELPGVPSGEVSTQVVAGVISQVMRPLLESLSTMLKNSTEAIEHLATSQDVIRNRLDALEKQQRLQTPVTDRQARYLADAAREKSRELLDKKGVTDKKTVTKLAGMIRKSVLSRYGFGSLREIPRCEYSVAMSQIETWMNAVTVLDMVREARARTEKENEQVE